MITPKEILKLKKEGKFQEFINESMSKKVIEQSKLLFILSTHIQFLEGVILTKLKIDKTEYNKVRYDVLNKAADEFDKDYNSYIEEFINEEKE